LIQTKVFPPLPTRFWRKKTGPRESSRIRIASSGVIQLSRKTRNTNEILTSRNRLLRKKVFLESIKLLAAKRWEAFSAGIV